MRQESIGARLRRLRLERHLSQRELAGSSLSEAYLSRIEAGLRTPSLGVLRSLARTLGVSAEYLETGAETPAAYRRELELSDAELALRLDAEPAQVEQVERTFAALVTRARAAGDIVSEGRARIGLGLALARRGAYHSAIEQLEKVDRSGWATPCSRPDVYATLGRAYAAVGACERAVELFERCLDDLSSRAPDDRANEFRFTSYLSCALADAGDLERARQVLLDVVGRCEATADPHARVHVNWSLARVASMAGEPVAAMKFMRRAIGLLEATEDTLELARAHLHCAEIAMLEGEAELAGPHLAQAERLFMLGADHRDLGALRTQQAKRAIALERPDEAISSARDALRYLEEHVVEQGGAWHALAVAQALKGQMDEAAGCFRKAVGCMRKSAEWREASLAYCEWAQALDDAGRHDEAAAVREELALARIRQIGAAARRRGQPSESAGNRLGR
ncbi:MAG TPA: helix-turn-helix transcriptional regulator [Gaiellaceae bacterium]|nr:helix-turn-helix transcriptional regulator [Gaiellaceae bacterium]